MTSTAFAGSVTGTIDDLFCGEMDPFVIGDSCVLFITEDKTNDKLAFVYSDYDLWDVIDTMADEVGKTTGMHIEIDMNYQEKFYNKNAIHVLKDYDSRYFYFRALDNGESITSLEEV
jgi:hypothetical protein